jgi:hypothetical protein
MFKLGVFAILTLAAFSAFASESSHWRGHEFHEIASLAAIPQAIQRQLDVGAHGISGVADKGRPFNITDEVDDGLPMRRLLAAGQDGNTWLVALERGGRGYSVQVFLFVKNEQRKHGSKR